MATADGDRDGVDEGTGLPHAATSTATQTSATDGRAERTRLTLAVRAIEQPARRGLTYCDGDDDGQEPEHQPGRGTRYPISTDT